VQPKDIARVPNETNLAARGIDIRPLSRAKQGRGHHAHQQTNNQQHQYNFQQRKSGFLLLVSIHGYPPNRAWNAVAFRVIT
jgi:hypothetical protein